MIAYSTLVYFGYFSVSSKLGLGVSSFRHVASFFALLYGLALARAPLQLLFVVFNIIDEGRRKKGKGKMWYLCVFYHRLLDYRKPEFDSLAELFGTFSFSDNNNNNNTQPRRNSLEWKLPHHHHQDSPFHFVNLPSEEIARNIANRSQYFFFLFFLFFFTSLYTHMYNTYISQYYM